MNRREVVKLGVVGISSACLGCGGGGGDEPTPDAFEGIGGEMCGANFCVDLTHPANAMLLNVDGARAVNVSSTIRLIIVRTSATEFAALSRICTHAQCSVAWQSTLQEFRCPCHGSRFSINGGVTNGPATRSLTKYGTMFDEATQTLTIVLA